MPRATKSTYTSSSPLSSATRIAVGAFIFFLIIGAGFAGGFYFNFKMRHDASNGLTPFKEAKPKINNNTYVISPPSIGTAIKTKSIPIHFVDGVSIMPFSPADAALMKTGTKIILYDKDNKLLSVLGEVTAVGGTPHDTSDKIFTTVTLMDKGIVYENIPVRGDVVIERNPALSRLPPEAVVQDDKGQPHVWEVHKQDDGTSVVYLKAINVPMTTDQFTGVEVPLGSSNVFVLNPDDALEDGQKINVSETLYAGPEYTLDQTVQASMTQFQEMRRKALEQAQSKLEPAPYSCPTVPDFVKKFKDTAQALKPAPAMSVPPTP